MGKPLLELMVERVRRCPYIDTIVIATTVNATDDPVVELANRLGIAHFRGSEHNVVNRVTSAMQANQADIVVQLTGDCPLIDPQIISQLVQLYAANSFDLVSNVQVRSYPKGLDIQVASLAVLEHSQSLCQNEEDREHLFYTVPKNPDKFRTYNLLAPPELCWPLWRWTLDTPEDYAFISRAFEQLYPANANFTARDLAAWMLTQPEGSR